MKVLGSAIFAAASATWFAFMSVTAHRSGDGVNTVGFGGAALFFLSCVIVILTTSRGSGQSSTLRRELRVSHSAPKAIVGDVVVATSSSYAIIETWALRLEAEEIPYQVVGANSGAALSFLAGEQLIQLIVSDEDAAKALSLIGAEGPED